MRRDHVETVQYDSENLNNYFERKWNASAEGAIATIVQKKYPESLRNFGNDIVFAGISYDKDAPAGDRKHTCRIVKEKLKKK